ncbi:MAG TPA: Gfo/Idh/MocA family oxidoreductase, partial [Solirubrobacteraceae bacterium]|nr:Gfo/Idh/MocA family oxidoreductase [Solirubrobacteraceae bacterium]
GAQVMDELNIGLIGAGRMGAYHVETWERVPCGRLTTIAEPDETTARARIGRRPIEWVSDYRWLLERADVDAVCICTPSEHHARVALDAIAAGKHVFVEKPIAIALEDGLRMAAAARLAGLKLVVGHVERFNPAVGKLAELIREGRIGRVFRAHATRVGPLPARIQDTGVAIDLATHDLDLMQFVLGRDISSIYAEGSRCVHPSQEDIISCLLRFGEDGPQGLLDVNWLTPEKRREMTVIGEGGMLSASYLTQDVWFTESTGAPTAWSELARIRGDAEGAAIRFALPRVEPLAAELQAFARCVLDDTPEPVSAQEGCRALAAALAVRDSAANRRPVQLLDTPLSRPVRVAA